MTFSVRWFGFGGNSWQAESVREDLELNGIELKTCHEYPNADVPYSRDTIYGFIDGADVVMLPARHQLQPAKSVNRLALAWSRRKACIVYPLDAYLKYVEDGKNALIVRNQEEMVEAVLRLRKDPQLRESLAGAGHNTAIRHLHPHGQIGRLFEALRGAEAADPWPVETMVQIIMPHYADRFDYIRLAVESALESRGPRRDILIVSSSASDIREKCPELLKDHRVRCFRSEERLSFAQANNKGFEMARPNATHFLLLNDDTVMGENALADMFGEMMKEGKPMILNPYSNCEKGWLHGDAMNADGLDLHPDMNLAEVEGRINAIKGFIPELKAAGLQPAPFCAMYCTLFPKEVLDRVGRLCTGFSNGGEDADYTYRAASLNIPSYWTRDAFVFHFGGKTRKFAEDGGREAHHEEDRRNNLLLAERWPKGKKRIGIWTGPAWEKWDLNAYREAGSGIGGSEYVEGCMAEAAAAEGHHVTLYTDIDEPKEQYGVHLVPWNRFIPEEEYFDLFIASRNVNCIDDRLKARTILVHVHDIWLSQNPHISDYHRSRVGRFVCLSPWHQEFFCGHHNVPKEKTVIIPNGIMTDFFEKPDPDAKEFGKFIFSSSPDRGLDNLIYILSFVKEKVPETHLDVYYGFHNWESAARQRGNPEEMKKIDALRKQLEDNKSWITLKGRVNQPALANAWHKAYMWLYPTIFTETNCITAQEAQLSATPILCSNVAALQTTVGDFGYRVQHHPYSFEGRTEFFNKAVHVLQDKDEWRRLSEISARGGEGISYHERWRDYWSKWL